MDRIHAHQFKSEAQLFRSGIQDATSADIDFSGESLTTLAQNHAFDSAGSRINVASGTLTGIFGGSGSAAPGTVSSANDAKVLTDPVPGSTTNRGRLIFGALAGLLVWLIRSFGGYPDGVAFAVLLANITVPLIDYYTRPRVYGHR